MKASYEAWEEETTGGMAERMCQPRESFVVVSYGRERLRGAEERNLAYRDFKIRIKSCCVMEGEDYEEAK